MQRDAAAHEGHGSRNEGGPTGQIKVEVRSACAYIVALLLRRGEKKNCEAFEERLRVLRKGGHGQIQRALEPFRACE